jgi:hypothetical protein
MKNVRRSLLSSDGSRTAIFGICLSFFLSLCLCVSAVNLPAQSGGTYEIRQSVIASGGGQDSSGGAFSVDGTAGQSVAGGPSSGGTFAVTSGFWAPAVPFGFEGDVAPRPNGDSAVQSNDVIQVQRFQIGLDLPNQSTNEFQRADSAPFPTRGDGQIASTDVVQTQRYAIGLDMQQVASGPGGPGGIPHEEIVEPSTDASKSEADAKQSDAVPESSKANPQSVVQGTMRVLRVENAAGTTAQQVVVNIRTDAVGDESAYGFTVNYDLTKLRVPTTAIGTAGGSRLCNTNTPGQIICSVANFPNNNPASSTDQIGEIADANNQLLLRITFTVAANAASGPTPVTLSGVNASNDAAANLAISSQNGVVNISGPTAADASISGSVTTADGRGIRNARLILTNAATGETRSALSSSFGYYRFDGVPVSQTYVLTINSKRFRFEPNTRVISLPDNLTDENFTALE